MGGVIPNGQKSESQDHLTCLGIRKRSSAQCETLSAARIGEEVAERIWERRLKRVKLVGL